MSVSLRTMPASERERREADIAGKWAALSPRLDERSRRLWLGAEARQLGYGGIRFVASATGSAIETVRGGVADLAEEPAGRGDSTGGRVRRAGGGRKKAEDKDPELPAVLDGLMDEEAAADPMTPRLRWTSKSLARLSGELAELGHESSPTLVRRLLYQTGWRLQSNNKSAEKSAAHPDRDGQFRYINRLAAAFAAAGQPVVSVDTKKKELAGNFANGGREWARSGEAPRVLDHDFPSWAEGKAIPYGIYDLAGNEGFVSVGEDHDTPAFAVAALESWWTALGAARYPDAARLLITAGSGGSSAASSRVCKTRLAGFAERHGLEEITVLHYPSGTQCRCLTY